MEYTVTDGSVAGRDGAIPIRDFRPNGSTDQAPYLWVRGGGFVNGTLDWPESQAPARYLAERGRWVRTLAYRLSPKIPIIGGLPRLGPAPGRFPDAHNDVLDVAAALRAESGRAIALGGASAGANLSAGAVLAMRDAGTELPTSLVLVYGAFHYPVPVNDEIEKGLHGLLPRWLFNDRMVKRIAINYSGLDGAQPAAAFPGGADLHGFPPTFTLDASNDRLRRSGHAFHDELKAAGVATDELVIENSVHGFLNTPKKPASAPALAAMDAWLRAHD